MKSVRRLAWLIAIALLALTAGVVGPGVRSVAAVTSPSTTATYRHDATLNTSDARYVIDAVSMDPRAGTKVSAARHSGNSSRDRIVFIAADTGAGGAARYAVDSSGNVTITMRNSSDSFELTEHAAQRATQRGISIDQIENTLGGNGFSYYNKGAGMYQTCYYDPASKVFVGTSGGQVTTVINNVKQNYINNLMNAGP